MFSQTNRSINRRSTQYVGSKNSLASGLVEEENSLRKTSSLEDIRKKVQGKESSSKDKDLEGGGSDQDQYSFYFKRYEILIEFANLRNPKQCPSGMYVMPSTENIHEWYGVLFVHKGYYKDAVIKFRMDIPLTYPENSPTVSFITDVFHPLVDQNGHFNLAAKFPKWTPRQDHIVDVLKFIKNIFKLSTLENLTEEVCLNKQAYRLYKHELHLFIRLSEQCAKLSYTESVALDEFPESNTINFKPLTDSKFEELYPQFLGPNATSTNTSSKPSSSLDNVISSLKKSVSSNLNKLFD